MQSHDADDGGGPRSGTRRVRTFVTIFIVLALLGAAVALAPGLLRREPMAAEGVAGRDAGAPLAAGTPASTPAVAPAPPPRSDAADPLALAAMGPGAVRVDADAPRIEPALARADARSLLLATGPDASYDCLIEPWETVELGSPVTGRIEALPVERGQTVDAGQVVVELDSAVETAAVELARARAELDIAVRASETALELGRRRDRRASNLYARQALSLDLREEIETEAELARLRLLEAREEKRLASLELQQAQQVLERRSIRSPIAGVIVDRPMSRGEVVDEEDEILRIAQIDPLRVEVILPSAMFGRIEAGTNAAVVPEIPGDSAYVASVEIIDALIDAASGTFRVMLKLPNPDHEIPAGLHCQVRFASEES